MQIFEFHFNPKAKSDVIFDSFCYEPENIYEKRIGSLYMLGFLRNTLPQNSKFLDNLAKFIKEKYYKAVSKSPEKSLRETLRKANEYLENIAKSGDVSWLGNFNFAVISVKNSELNFTKVGDLKLFLLRKGHIIDIDQKLKFEDIEPYPLKIFGNIISGKLVENDILIVSSTNISDFFVKEKILAEIASVIPFEQKRLKEILNNKKDLLSKLSGLCLLINSSKEAYLKEMEDFSQKKHLKAFSLKAVFSPFLKIFKLPQIKLPRIRLRPKITKPKAPKLKIPEFKWFNFKIDIKKPRINLKNPFANRKWSLILLLAIFLALGFFIFEKSEERQLENYREQLNQIQEKVSQAEAYLILSDNPQARKNANDLYKESWKNIGPFFNLASSFPADFAQDILDLRETISDNLYQLNKLTIIEEPELVFEFKPREFVPHKISYLEGSIYAFSPYVENLVEIKDGSINIYQTGEKFLSATGLGDTLLLFAKPDKIIPFKEGQLQETFSLYPPYPEFDFDDFSSYQGNLYFLDGENEKIIKYPYSGNEQWGLPQLWTETSNTKNFKSMAVDGSIWFLDRQNHLERYYGGRLAESFELEIFPEIKVLSKVKAYPGLPYLYILEPAQQRVIIIDKSGNVIRQLQSKKFDNLLDFSVTKEGRDIYLLNGLNLYKIKVEG
ncbi:MAG: hypothetical protein Q8P08_02190 [bacterium]|nr:hypothetical protein [bacterium]